MPSWNCVALIGVITEGGSKCYETKQKKVHKMFSRRCLNFREHSGNLDIDGMIILKLILKWEWRVAKNLGPVNQNILRHILKDYNLKSLKHSGHYMYHQINTFAASYLNTQGLNNSCLKSPAATLVDLTFQSRTLRSFSLNQLRNLSL